MARKKAGNKQEDASPPPSPSPLPPDLVRAAAKECLVDIYATISDIAGWKFGACGEDEADEELMNQDLHFNINKDQQFNLITLARSNRIYASLPIAGKNALQLVVGRARRSLDPSTRAIAEQFLLAGKIRNRIKGSRLEEFSTRFGWLLLSVCAFSYLFRRVCWDDSNTEIWTALCNLIEAYEHSVELFALARNLQWEESLTSCNDEWHMLFLSTQNDFEASIRTGHVQTYGSLDSNLFDGILPADYMVRHVLFGNLSHPHKWALSGAKAAYKPNFSYRRDDDLVTKNQVNIMESVVADGPTWRNRRQWPIDDPRYRGFGKDHGEPCLACHIELKDINSPCDCTPANLPRKWVISDSIEVVEVNSTRITRSGRMSGPNTAAMRAAQFRKEVAKGPRYTQPKLIELVELLGKGIGVRALQNIQKDDILGEYIGEIFPETAPEAYPNDQDIHYRFGQQIACRRLTMDLSPSPLSKGECNIIIDSAIRGNWTRYINHSCRQNTTFRGVNVGDKRRIVVVADRDIDFGEEITVHYGKEFWDNASYACMCGEDNCCSLKKATGSTRDNSDSTPSKPKTKITLRLGPEPPKGKSSKKRTEEDDENGDEQPKERDKKRLKVSTRRTRNAK